MSPVIQARVEETLTCLSATDIITTCLGQTSQCNGWEKRAPRSFPNSSSPAACCDRLGLLGWEATARTGLFLGPARHAHLQADVAEPAVCALHPYGKAALQGAVFTALPREVSWLFSYSHTSGMHGRVFKSRFNLYLQLFFM